MQQTFNSLSLFQAEGFLCRLLDGHENTNSFLLQVTIGEILKFSVKVAPEDDKSKHSFINKESFHQFMIYFKQLENGEHTFLASYKPLK